VQAVTGGEGPVLEAGARQAPGRRRAPLQADRIKPWLVPAGGHRTAHRRAQHDNERRVHPDWSKGGRSVYRVSVYVTPKAGVVDPQGAVVERALPALGHSGVHNIRVGRYITLEVEGDDAGKVSADVDDMCRRLLANPIIEDYRFDVLPVGTAAGEGT